MPLQLASFVCALTSEYGTEDQCEEYVRQVAIGDRLSDLAVSEPDTGSDLAGMQTRADRDGDEYVLNGEKYWIGNGVEANWIPIYALSSDVETNRYGNDSLPIVPTDAGSTRPNTMSPRPSERRRERPSAVGPSATARERRPAIIGRGLERGRGAPVRDARPETTPAPSMPMALD